MYKKKCIIIISRFRRNSSPSSSEYQGHFSLMVSLKAHFDTKLQRNIACTSIYIVRNKITELVNYLNNKYV